MTLRERAREKVKSLEFAVTQTAFADSRAELEEELELARIALASLEAEPVAWDHEWASCITCDGPQNFERIIEHEAPPEWAIKSGQARNLIPLYTAPPAPVFVPDLKGLDEFIFNLVSAMASEELSHNEKELFRIASKYISYARERFSSAMLQGAEPVSNRDELTDAVNGLLAVMDEYPESLVPINRDSAVVRQLRAAAGD